MITVQGRQYSAHRTLIIGEVAQAHDGSLGLAHEFIDAVAIAGADAVKFQTHIANAESTPREPWRVKLALPDASRMDYWRRMEFTHSQWVELKRHADDRGLMFLSTPFSIEAVDLLATLDLAAWKVSSGDIGNAPLLERIAATGRPVLLSSGMSDFAELDAAVKRVQGHGLPLVVLQCTSAYPCPPEHIGLNLLSSFRERYGTDVGLSDHSGTIFPGLAAATIGATVLEVHVTLSREMSGPDVTSSVTTSELRQLVDGVRLIQRMTANPVDKDAMAEDLGPMRAIFTKSVVARHALPAGTILAAEHLALKRPGSGLPASRIASLIGRKLTRTLEADDVISESDLA